MYKNYLNELNINQDNYINFIEKKVKDIVMINEKKNL